MKTKAWPMNADAVTTHRVLGIHLRAQSNELGGRGSVAVESGAHERSFAELFGIPAKRDVILM